MDNEEFSFDSARNVVVIDAVVHAFLAMSLTTGCTIDCEGIRGNLQFERQLELLRRALVVLGVDIEALP